MSKNVKRRNGEYEKDYMNPWELFSYLCKQVVEEQNVYLDVMVTPMGIEMMLFPYNEEEYETDD